MTAYVTLSYAADLSPSGDGEGIVRSIIAGILDVLGTDISQGDVEVTSSTIRPGSSLIKVRIASARLGIPTGGLARILAVVIGNAFRHEDLVRLFLADIQFDPEVLSTLRGPSLGASGLRDRWSETRFPLFSAPIPAGLSPNERLELLATLSRLVDIISEGTLSLVDPANIVNDAQAIRRHTSRDRPPPLFFSNGTLTLNRLEEALQIAGQLNVDFPFVGLRVCPLSIGLNTCMHIQAQRVPIFGYNGLGLPGPTFGRREIGPGVLTRLFRIAGCDLINVGLQASNAANDIVASEISEAAKADLGSVRRSVPVFTGGLTPRVVHGIVQKYGRTLVLHMKSPLTRGGLGQVEENLAAFREAAQCALDGKSIKKALASADRSTQYWRRYEERYGET